MFSKGLLLALLLAGAAQAQSPTVESSALKAPLPLRHPVQDKNFYLFSLMEETPAVRTALLQAPELAKLTANRFAASADVATQLDASAATYVHYFLWTDAEIQAVADTLRALYRSDPNVRALVSGPLRRSGAAITLEHGSDEDMLVATWITEAHGINGIFQTYGLGNSPAYPQIDAISYDPATSAYRQALHQAAWTVCTTDSVHSLFFAPSLHFAMYLLSLNRRDEAGRFEPMESGENAAAIAHLAEIHWSAYPYSVILIPGIGPENPGVALSPMGRLHVVAAAKEFDEGKAPIILVSGGFVHPSQTQFNEAIEMKKALMRDYNIPESAILVDPHARHTTTNFRNAAREMFRYNIPLNKVALATSDLYQSRYIEDARFPDRCVRELGYPCFFDLRRVSPIDLEWRPNIDSLQQNPADPLDP